MAGLVIGTAYSTIEDSEKQKALEKVIEVSSMSLMALAQLTLLAHPNLLHHNLPTALRAFAWEGD